MFFFPEENPLFRLERTPKNDNIPETRIGKTAALSAEFVRSGVFQSVSARLGEGIRTVRNRRLFRVNMELVFGRIDVIR